MPAAYIAKSDVEKALQDSLRQLELQAKERVDLLEALRDSRKEAAKDGKSETRRRKLEKGKGSVESLATDRTSPGWLGGGTIPPMSSDDLPKAPNLPPRPSLPTNGSTETLKETRSYSVPMPPTSGLGAPPTLPVPSQHVSRSPSPDTGRKTMRTTLRAEKKGFKSSRSAGNQRRRPDPMKAASLAWDVKPRAGSQASLRPESDPTIEARLSATAARRSLDQGTPSRRDSMRRDESVRMPDPADHIPNSHWRELSDPFNQEPSLLDQQLDSLNLQSDPVQYPETSNMDDLLGLETPPPPPPHAPSLSPVVSKRRTRSPPRLPKPPDISYRREYPKPSSDVPPVLATKILDRAYNKTAPQPPPSRNPSGIHRKPLANSPPPKESRPKVPRARTNVSSGSESEKNIRKVESARPSKPRRTPTDRKESTKPVTPPSTDADSHEENAEQSEGKTEWEVRVEKLMANLPKGVDENAAKQVFNEIVVEGDEVHWDDVAGLDGAKKALKEAVVYPFLRPDLFMGLREPARGMLLFGPAGTGKTMLARAVATESKSTFFAISASSLTSKWHGESEKLVRALFALAKALAPSIIFVDEIDSLLSSRSGSSEHEASRRSKTEFLIQWSDLQKAAAGRDTSKEIGDASRVLVLAATNLPWDIDEAARRRFVRRQYIPLPEGETREVQIRTLIGHQKHDLSARDIWRIVEETDGMCFPLDALVKTAIY
jgi:fidgetin-like protein 1